MKPTNQKLKKEAALDKGDKKAAGPLTAGCCPQQRFTGFQGVQAIESLTRGMVGPKSFKSFNAHQCVCLAEKKNTL